MDYKKLTRTDMKHLLESKIYTEHDLLASIAYQKSKRTKDGRDPYYCLGCESIAKKLKLIAVSLDH